MSYHAFTFIHTNKLFGRLICLLLLCSVPSYSAGGNFAFQPDNDEKKECIIDKTPLDFHSVENNVRSNRRMKWQSPSGEWHNTPSICLMFDSTSSLSPKNAAQLSSLIESPYGSCGGKKQRHIVLCVYRI
ncbi:MAG: hypothetical protein ACK5JU_09695 [Bacteroidales bacterium]